MIQLKWLSILNTLRQSFKLLKQDLTQTFALLFAIGLGLSLAVVACTPTKVTHSATTPTAGSDPPKLTVLKIILEELDKAGAWSKSNQKESAKLLSSLYKIDLPTMEVVEQRGGDRRL